MKSLHSQNSKSKSLYIGIKRPVELRRNLLESSKLVIESMKVQKKLKSIHLEKEMLKSRLKKDITELDGLLARLERLVPHDTFLALRRRKQAASSNLLQGKDEKQVEADDPDLKNIHSQLLYLEKRLAQLGK